jgi:hypothetical protein
MTRDEAIAKVQFGPKSGPWPDYLIDMLEALGLLYFDPAGAGQDDAVRIAAAERLIQAHTQVFSRNDSAIWGKMTRDGAYEILDVLLKSGFKITHD